MFFVFVFKFPLYSLFEVSEECLWQGLFVVVDVAALLWKGLIFLGCQKLNYYC